MWSTSRQGRVRVDRLAILGCGMIGCSFAAAAKAAGIARSVVGYSKSPTTVNTALELGWIDDGADSAMKAISGADAVLIAVPVSATEALLRMIRHGITDDMLVMDVGSTKRDVAEAAERALVEKASHFVPVHPIAGKDSSGPQAADAALFKGRWAVLTPTVHNDSALVEKAQDLWEAVGAKAIRMSAEEHDSSCAAVSHMPHLISFAYMNSILRQPGSQDLMRLAGTGFRDFTRIAGADPAVWRDIFMANRDELMMQLGLFKQHLAAIEAALMTQNAESAESLISRASTGRRRWAERGAEAMNAPLWEGEEL
jgi:prephenate dehydrogenase